ncbi:uncharacterized protein LOC125666410 [Ostrea edulis]|uniref:uncharacterized protein LOC125666410 n=1 Tax=Ostrea edulis TaxID=37623 RepID=UPI0024AF92E3|nr:uncharacterized protein LOC125666410 [Ostrea edulis]
MRTSSCLWQNSKRTHMEPSKEIDPVNIKKEPSSPHMEDTHSMKSKRTSKHGSRHSSRHSSSSSTSKRAKAEAARALIKLAEEEAALRKKLSQLEEQDDINQATIKASAARRKADYQADMDLLTARKTAAALDAEARVFEQDFSGSDISEDDIPVPKEDPQKRTSEYVSDVCTREQSDILYHGVSVIPQNTTNLSSQTEPQQENQTTDIHDADRVTRTDHPVDEYISSRTQPLTPASSYVELLPSVFLRSNHLPHVPDISKFLLRKELLISRLYRFSDRPESYFVWKSSFQNILTDLQVMDFEQLDLLVKWLGPESSSYALSIRTANVDCPAKTVRLLWERLDQRYGSPERIQSLLKDKLAKFPKLNFKDSLKLYELADLCEILSLKQQPMYQPLPAYFDSSVGVNPIIEKLPNYMKEKWVTRASRYKETNRQCFPPFKFFVDFVKEMSRVRNDPSFSYSETGNPPMKYVRSTTLASKIQIPTAATAKREISSDSKDKTPMCAIHGTSHRLSECRAFQAKSMEARKSLLKEKGLCFKCCDFAHKSRHYKEKLACTLCNSDKHTTVMHGDIPLKFMAWRTLIELRLIRW